MAKEHTPQMMYRRLMKVAKLLASVSTAQEIITQATEQEVKDPKKPKNGKS